MCKDAPTTSQSLWRARFGVAVSTLLAFVALTLPGAASAAEKALNTDLSWGISAADQDKTVAGIQDLGAKWVRLNMDWNSVESRKGTYRFGSYDTAIQKADASGAKVLVTVYQSPQWASGSSNSETPPQNPADYANFMATVATRYAGQIDALQVWNEENLPRFWSTGPNAGQYAQLLKAAYQAIKGQTPNMTVVFGGISGNDYAYLEAAYQAMPDLGNYYDVMAVHPYTFPAAPPEAVALDGNGRVDRWSFPGYREIHTTMTNHATDKPMWFTEMGWSTNTLSDGVSEATQADYLTRAYRCIEQDPYVQVAFTYTYRNNYWANDANNWEDQLGLVRTDFTHKPAYDAYKNYTPGNTGCQYWYPSSSPSPTAADGQPQADPQPTATTATTATTDPQPDAEPQPDETPVEIGPINLRIVRVGRVAGSSAGRTTTLTRRVRLRIVGRIEGASGGHLTLRLERRVDGKWRRRASFRPPVSKTGRFETRTTTRRAGRWRVRAVYRHAEIETPRPRLIRFRLV